MTEWLNAPVLVSTLKHRMLLGMWMRNIGKWENRVFQEHESYDRVMGALLHFYQTA